MPKPKVLALVMAGGEGSRLELLTERRAKPALPYAGVYRLIDFPLSNCLHSGIEDVWVAQPTTSTGSTTARCWPATATGGPG
jgi:glucose-1-phosphate adenylyltransferase